MEYTKNNYTIQIIKAKNGELCSCKIDIYNAKTKELLSSTKTYNEFTEMSLELMLNELSIKDTKEYKKIA